MTDYLLRYTGEDGECKVYDPLEDGDPVAEFEDGVLYTVEDVLRRLSFDVAVEHFPGDV